MRSSEPGQFRGPKSSSVAMRTFLTLILALASFVSWAQGTVRGVVSDPKGETLIGATVVLKADPSKGVVTDLDGRYSLGIPSGVPVVLVYSFVGYEPKEVAVTAKPGEVVVQNVVLGEKSVLIKEFEVEAKARRGSDGYLDRMKSNANRSWACAAARQQGPLVPRVTLLGFSLLLLVLICACAQEPVDKSSSDNSAHAIGEDVSISFPGMNKLKLMYPDMYELIARYEKGDAVPAILFSDSLDFTYGRISHHGRINCVRQYLIDSVASQALLDTLVSKALSNRATGQPVIPESRTRFSYIQEPCSLSVLELALLRSERAPPSLPR